MTAGEHRQAQALRGLLLVRPSYPLVGAMGLRLGLEAGAAMDRGEAVDGALEELAKVLQEAGIEHAARLRGSVVGNA